MAKATHTEPDPTSLVPPVAVSSTAVTATDTNYPDSLDSSPRSRATDTEHVRLDDVPSAAAAPANSAPPGKLRLMCSYGGRIIPRPHDKSLCYLGGETKIVVVDRHASLADLISRISRQLLSGRSFTLKYQLPHEDLDSLISLTTDDDLDSMIEEYDRCALSPKPSRLRLFVFPAKADMASGMAPLLEGSMSEPWFVDALNGTVPVGSIPRGVSDTSAASINRLLGLDSVDPNNSENQSHREHSGGEDGGVAVAGASGMAKPAKRDVHSLPDSPMMGTFSSFGSTSSAPSVSNLPPIGVKVEDQATEIVAGPANTGVEEQLCQNTLDPGIPKCKPEPELPPSRENLTPPPQPVQPTAPVIPKPVYYQHPSRIPTIPVANLAVSEPKMEHADLNYKVQMPYASDTGFLVPHALPPEYHYLQPASIPPPPIPSFYQVHHRSQQQPQQQQVEQRTPLYLFHPPASTMATLRQNHAYNLAAYQPVVADASSKPSPSPITLRAKDTAATLSCAAPPQPPSSHPAPQPELGASLYRSSATPAMAPLASVPLIHPTDQQQYAGYRLPTTHLGYGYGDSFPHQILYNHTLPVSTPSAATGEAPLHQSPDEKQA